MPGKLDCPPSARLIKAPWPLACGFAVDVEETFAKLQEIIQAIRNIRNEYKVDQKKSVSVSIIAQSDLENKIKQNRELIELLATCTIAQVQPNSQTIQNTTRATAAGCEIFIEGLIDADAEKQRSEKRRDELSKQIAALKGRLNNAGYIAKVPPHLVQETQNQLTDAETELAKLS